MANGWTQERRLRQSQLIHRWKPWKKAGVKTETGKKIIRMNAYKHGGRGQEVRQVKKAFADHKKILRQFMKTM